MSITDAGAMTGHPRPSNRRCSVSFQDTCTVIPEFELRKPRLCTRTYSVCLSKKPTSDLLYDETFIPSQPTTLKFHLPSFTRAPPLPHRARSRRSSTGGTPGFFGYQGPDKCGLRSCLLKSAHKEYLQDVKEHTSPETGPKATPAIVHRDSPNEPATPLQSIPSTKSSSGILSPVLGHSHSQASPPQSPIHPPASPTSNHGFGMSKVSALVARPFLRRSKPSSSTVPRSESQDSVHVPLLSRSRSTSVGASSLRKAASDVSSHALTRSQSVNSPSTGTQKGEPKPNLVPLDCEKLRHPGCIDEEATAENEEEDIMSSPLNLRADNPALQSTPTQPPSRASLLHSPMQTDLPITLPIHDCCEACTRNTLLGMREDYTPPFSPSAIRKIQREREEKQERVTAEKDIAKAVSVPPPGSKRVWDGRAWVEEHVSTSEQAPGKAATEGADEDSDEDPEQRPSSILGPTFDNEKAKKMMVDEVEYVRRLRRASSTSTLEQVGEQSISEASSSKRACVFNGEKIRKSRPEDTATATASPDHGIWITSKPSPSRCSPHFLSKAGSQQDYWSAKPVTNSSGDEEVKMALVKEAEDAKLMSKDVDTRHRSQLPNSQSPVSDSERRKWFGIPLTSPLVVPGVG